MERYLEDERTSHVAVWIAVWVWIQRFNPRSFYRCNKVSPILIDETMLQIGFDQAWLWIAAVERTIKYLKDRSEGFDDYYQCIKSGLCNLRYVHKWVHLFVFNTVVKADTKLDDLRRWKYHC
jgi:hypothetical protein